MIPRLTSILIKDIRDLATKLSQADALSYSLLNYRRVIKVIDPVNRKVTAFSFIFNIPDGLGSPRSLRDILIYTDVNLSLSNRFRITQQLGTSVSYVHTYGFVHKYIRPETVLIFRNPKSPLTASFLLGFKKFRLAKGRTIRFRDCI